jgi:hypothetical protein
MMTWWEFEHRPRSATPYKREVALLQSLDMVKNKPAVRLWPVSYDPHIKIRYIMSSQALTLCVLWLRLRVVGHEVPLVETIRPLLGIQECLCEWIVLYLQCCNL